LPLPRLIKHVECDVGQQRRDRRALWGARTRLGGHPTLQHPCLQPRPDELEQPPVTDPPGDLRRQSLVIDRAEAVTDIGVQHPFAAPVGLDPHGVARLVGRALRAEPVAVRQEVGLEDRLQDQLRRCHGHPVTHRRNAERPGLARLTRLGDVDPAQRRRPVGPGPKRCREVLEERCHPGRLDLGDGDPIHAGRPSV
jgi:hypothetical protein